MGSVANSIGSTVRSRIPIIVGWGGGSTTHWVLLLLWRMMLCMRLRWCRVLLRGLLRHGGSGAKLSCRSPLVALVATLLLPLAKDLIIQTIPIVLNGQLYIVIDRNSDDMRTFRLIFGIVELCHIRMAKGLFC